MLVKSQGIVLREIKFEETSKILTVFSRKDGKINAIAKGALRPRSPLIACSQIFTYNDYNFFKGRNFYHISQGEVLDSFYSIREDMKRLMWGYYLLELVEYSIVEEEPNEKLFKLLVKGLSVLSKLDRDFLKFVISFEIKAVSFIGYKPRLEKCVACGGDIEGNIRFSAKQGGVICHNCFDTDFYSDEIDLSLLKYMQILLYTPLDNIGEIKIPKDVMFKIHGILVKYILQNIDKNCFKSLNFIKSLENNGGI